MRLKRKIIISVFTTLHAGLRNEWKYSSEKNEKNARDSIVIKGNVHNDAAKKQPVLWAPYFSLFTLAWVSDIPTQGERRESSF